MSGPRAGTRRAHGPWLLGLVALLMTAACAPKVEVENPSPFDEDDPAALSGDAPVETVAAPAPVDRNSTCPPRTATTRRRVVRIQRSALIAFLEGEVSSVLRGLEFKARFAGKRFIGWEILRFMPCERRFDGIDLLPGDLVRQVNGRQIARPDQVGDLWKALRTADAVIVQVRRGGEDFELRFEVSFEGSLKATKHAKPAVP